MVSVFANGPGDLGSLSGRVIPKTQKMVLDAILLNTQHYKVLSRVKWSNLGKEVAPSPTPRCSSYRKRILRVTLDYGRQLYLLSSIWPIDRALSGVVTQGQSGPGSDGNERVLHIPQSSSITGTSQSDVLMSYPGHQSKGMSLPFCRGAVDVFYSPSRQGKYDRLDTLPGWSILGYPSNCSLKSCNMVNVGEVNVRKVLRMSSKTIGDWEKMRINRLTWKKVIHEAELSEAELNLSYWYFTNWIC